MISLFFKPNQSPLYFLISLYSILCFFSLHAETLGGQDSIEKNEQLEEIQFNPPQGWRYADNAALPPKVQVMVVGKGSKEFPPSISLAHESYSGSLKDYLKIVKELNASKEHKWKNLGTIKTQAGNASLSQTDSHSQWGDIRMMHVIIKKNGTVYILTAAALKEEFPQFYKEIFSSLRSLRI